MELTWNLMDVANCSSQSDTEDSHTLETTLVDVECDPLLSALIRRCDLYAGIDESEEVEDHAVIVNGSEFEDYDGCLYRVVSVDTTRVHSRCCYPRSNNVKFGLEKSFDNQLAKELIERRLNG